MNSPHSQILVPQGYGFLELCREEQGNLVIHGWLLRVNGPYDEFEVRLLEGRRLAAEYEARPDLAQTFPHVKGSERGGFRAEIPIADLGPQEVLEFHVVGLVDGEPRGCMYVGYHRSPIDQGFPPPEVMKRAAGNPSQVLWRATGIKNCHDMLKSLAPYVGRENIGSLLEWGCGSGRLTTHLIDMLPGATVSGTDIDSEAVQWASDYLKGTFKPCRIEPPLPFADSEFDAIVSLSVFSHLTRHYQEVWLEEIRRVLKPGGLFAASTHGRYAGRWIFPRDCERLLASGFYDDLPDAALGHVASGEYYRATFQTYEYTKPFWGEYFEVLDFCEGAMSNLQDIYVLRRRADGA